MSAPARELTHGSETAYSYHGCRCDECRAGRAARVRARRAEQPRKPRKPREPRPLPEHGTPARYQRSCRCDECRAARAEQSREYRDRHRTGEPKHPYHAPAPAPCEHLHADAVLDLLDKRARVLEKAVARRSPGAAQRRIEVLQLRAALKRYGVTR